MFKAFSIFFLLVASKGLSQTVDGFVNVKFGSSPEIVKNIMLAKPGCTLDTKNSDSKRLIFDGVKFAGRKTMFVAFNFIDDKLFNGSAFFRPALESKTVEMYNEIKDEINEKYYTTDDDFETYKTPYEKGDGYTEQAIKLGKASFASYWKSKNTSSESAESNVISLEITETLNIALNYQDGKLSKINASRNKEKNSADY